MTLFFLLVFTGSGHHYQVPIPYTSETACYEAGARAQWIGSSKTKDIRPMSDVAPFTCIGVSRATKDTPL